MKYGLKEKDIKLLNKTFKKFPEIKNVFIYGSRAQGSHAKTSELDLAIEFAKKKTHSLANIKSDLDDLPVVYELDICDQDEFSKGGFLTEYERTKKIFYRPKNS